jgi:DNA-binding protein YbaB
VKDAEAWLDRLRQVQALLKRWEGMIPEGSESEPAVGSPSYAEWLDEQIAQSGYTGLSFTPIEDSYWSALAEKVSVDSIRIAALADKDLSVLAENLASNPKQLSVSPRIEMASDDGSIGMLMQLDELSGAGANQLGLSFDGLDAKSTLSALKPDIAKRVNGGRIDLSLDGEFRYAGEGELTLDLLATLTDSELIIKRRKLPVANFMVPVKVRGSFAAPKVRVDNKAMEDQLKGVAENALKEEAKSRVEDKIKSKLGDRLKGFIK